MKRTMESMYPTTTTTTTTTTTETTTMSTTTEARVGDERDAKSHDTAVLASASASASTTQPTNGVLTPTPTPTATTPTITRNAKRCKSGSDEANHVPVTRDANATKITLASAPSPSPSLSPTTDTYDSSNSSNDSEDYSDEYDSEEDDSGGTSPSLSSPSSKPSLLEPVTPVPDPTSPTCSSLDPDTYASILVRSYLGYAPIVRSAVSLPVEKAATDADAATASPSSSVGYFRPITDEMQASYDVAIVSAVRENDLDGPCGIKALRSLGYRLETCNRFGESLLHMTCRRGYLDAYRYLTSSSGGDVSVRIKDDCGRTPLHDAMWNRHPQYDIVDHLLRTEASLLWIADKRGATPFMYARREHWGVWKKFLYDRADVLARGMDGDGIRELFGGGVRSTVADLRS